MKYVIIFVCGNFYVPNENSCIVDKNFQYGTVVKKHNFIKCNIIILDIFLCVLSYFL
jgi:hypothetical protein